MPPRRNVWASSTGSCPHAELDATVAALARESPTVRRSRSATRGAWSGVAASASLAEQLQAEAVSFGQCAADADFAEGIGAFLDKRAPRFARDPE